MKTEIMFGNLLVCFLIGGVGVWSSTTKISGAVIAPGTLVVDSNIKKIQHSSGGIISEILVNDGDHVNINDLLIRLDPTISKSSMNMLNNNYNELLAKKSRLEAESSNKKYITIPDEIAGSFYAFEESKLFDIRIKTRNGQKDQLNKRIIQLNQEIKGNQEQIQSKNKELVFVKKELSGIRDLYSRGLSTISRLNNLERSLTRIEGERGALESSIAQISGKISETELQILQVDKEFVSEVNKELIDTEAKLSELIEKRVASRDQLNRIDIRATSSGIIHQLNVHTIGGVITPGEVILSIVPESSLIVESKISPNDIQHVKIDQKTYLKFTSFDSKITPDIEGKVKIVSADSITDTKTNTSYYIAKIEVSKEKYLKLGNVKLVPGMPVESFIRTEDRTVLSYLTKPIMDQVYHSFREN